MTLDEYLTSIADALRIKKGSTEKIKAENFAQEILDLKYFVSTIQFVSDGEVISSQTLANGDVISIPANPIKESTAQYNYNFIGWSLDGETIVDVPSRMGITDVTYTALFEEELRYYTIRFLNGNTVLQTERLPYGEMPVYKGDVPVCEEDAAAEFIGWDLDLCVVLGDRDYYAEFLTIPTLNNSSWAEISEISASGEAENYFAVGDTKMVTLNGTVGTLALNYDTYNVYILGFDHNKDVTGDTGITFGTFKTTDGIDVALCDDHYFGVNVQGEKWFNMNHWGNVNHGGWAASDLRYDILGSTDVAPSGYGAARTTSDAGNNASATCATKPVANTLMAALPADLRAVMKPMTIYTDNVGNSSNVEANVTPTTDYLPLLAEYEICGIMYRANEYEQNKQAQYAYYAVGNSAVKYKHSYTKDKSMYWLRSPWYEGDSAFSTVGHSGTSDCYSVRGSYALAPMFLV